MDKKYNSFLLIKFDLILQPSLFMIWHFSTDNLKGSPAAASPVTEYGSVTAKFPEKCYTAGTDSPLRSKLLINRAKIHHQPLNITDTNGNIHQYGFLCRNFGNRNVFFLLLSVAIHNIFEGMNKIERAFWFIFIYHKITI